VALGQEGELGVAADAGEDVVEVVGDAAGEEPQALQLLGLLHLQLEVSPLVGSVKMEACCTLAAISKGMLIYGIGEMKRNFKTT
ncbi:MAG: hypothetical protein HGA25_07120, partial [Clostridiales bacterium]|nr:hypothetical protein [Clostridiales bacterium]